MVATPSTPSRGDRGKIVRVARYVFLFPRLNGSWLFSSFQDYIAIFAVSPLFATNLASPLFRNRLFLIPHQRSCNAVLLWMRLDWYIEQIGIEPSTQGKFIIAIQTRCRRFVLLNRTDGSIVLRLHTHTDTHTHVCFENIQSIIKNVFWCYRLLSVWTCTTRKPPVDREKRSKQRWNKM